MSNLSMRLRKTVASLAIASLLSTFLAAVPVQGAFSSYVDEAARGFVDEAGANTPSSRYEAVAIMNAALDLGTCEDELPFTDVPADHSNRADVQAAFCSGLVFGEGGTAAAPSETFNGEEVLNRAEYAAMMSRALGWADADLPEASLSSAQEAELEGKWYAEFAMQAYAAGVIRGFAGEGNILGMDRGIISQDAALMACRGIGACETPTEEEEEEDSTLRGGAGSVEEYDLVSAYSDEEVGEDEDDVVVYGLEIEADDSSDLNFVSFRVTFADEGADNTSDDFDKYFSEVSVWYGDELLAREDASEFDDDNDYSKTLTFEEDAIVRAGETEEFYIAVSGIANLDSDYEGEDWNVEIEQVRFQDAQGALITEDPAQGTVVFTAESFASASDVQLKVNLATTSPDEGIVAVDDTSDTDMVLLTEGTFKTRGSEINVDDIPVTFISTGSDVADIADKFTFVFDGVSDSKQPTDGTATDLNAAVEVLDCAGNACTVTFDDFDKDLDADETYSFQIYADIKELDDFAAGDSLSAVMSSDAVEAINAEDGTGEDLTASELEGSATGEPQRFFENYLDVNVVSLSNSSVQDNADNSTVTMVVELTAVGDTIYVNGDDNNTSEALTVALLAGNGDTTLGTPVYTLAGDYTVTNNGANNEYYTINEDDTLRITMTVTLTQANTTTTAGAQVTAINFGDTIADTDEFALDWSDLTDQLESPLVTLVP